MAAKKATDNALKHQIRELESAKAESLKAVERLRKNKARQNKMVANIGDVIVIIDQNGINRYKSPNVEKRFGWKPEELVGTCAWDNVHPDDLEQTLGFFEQILRTPDVIQTMECRYQCKDGTYQWIEFTGSNLLHDPDIKGILGNYHNITNRKNAEQTLRDSELRYRLLFEQSPIGIFHFDQTGTIVDCNDNFITIIGSSRERLIGLNMQTLPDKKLVAQIQNALNKHSGFYEGVYHSVTAKKSTPVKVYVAPLLDKNKRFFGGVGIVEDVTESRRSEDALRKREHLLQRIFEILPIGLWFADKDGNLIQGNPMGVKIWGAEPRVPISEYGIFKAWHLPSREPIKAEDWALAKTIRHGVTIVDELLEIEAFDGQKKTILNYTAPIFDDTGAVDGAIVVNLDVSDRKALELQLTQAQKMESVGRLAGGVAHDFNNMLTVILGYTQAAMDGMDSSDPLYTNLQEILNAARRSADLTKQLLTFARKQIIAPKALDLNQTVKKMMTMLQRLIGEDIDLVWKPAEKLWPVKMDPSQVDQVVANLCVNARDAIKGVGKITIETNTIHIDAADCKAHMGSVPGDFVLLKVSDTGCGMDLETLDNLFEPFFTTKDTGKGTGLGLATVYGVVKQNNGFINVNSRPGQGATFNIYLPRHHSTDMPSDLFQPAEPSPRGSETILLVEDEPAILNITQLMLERQGYTVIPAGNPLEAIALASAFDKKIHLLLTDVVMPKMNGRDLAKHLAKTHPDLKQLFMSGYTADVIAHQGVLDKGLAFIQKPFSLKELTEKIRRILDGE